MDAVFDKLHRQIPDPTPVELPLGYSHPPTMQQQMAMMIHVHESMAKANEMDSEEEANDFDIQDEEFAGDSRHVYTELHEEKLKELEHAFKSRANRIPASDQDAQDDDGEPLSTTEENEEPTPPTPPARKPGFKPGKKRAKPSTEEPE